MLPYVAKPPRSANALAVIIAHVGFGQSKNFWGTSTTSILAGILQGETEKKIIIYAQDILYLYHQ